MSRQQQHHEALRWLTTAHEDLAAAKVLNEREMYSHCCFLAQQAAEKAVKSVWLELDEDPWGHSIQKLIRELPSSCSGSGFDELLHAASTLDRYYIPARYPNGLPDLTPGTTFDTEDATLALKNATAIIETADQFVSRPAL